MLESSTGSDASLVPSSSAVEISKRIGSDAEVRTPALAETSRADHTLRRVESDSVGETRLQSASNHAGATAYIEEGPELALSGGVMVQDGLIDFWRMIPANLRILLALVLIV